MNIKSGLLKHKNTSSITTDGDGDYKIDSIVNGTTKIPIALKCSNNNPSALPYVFYATGGSVFIRFFKRDNTGNAANTSIGVVTVYYLDFS